MIEIYKVYDGQYWSTGDNESTLSKNNFGASIYSGGVGNTYYERAQCYAFALFFAKLLYGSSPEIMDSENWVTVNLSNISLQPGDVIRTGYYTDDCYQEHSAVMVH